MIAIFVSTSIDYSQVKTFSYNSFWKKKAKGSPQFPVGPAKARRGARNTKIIRKEYAMVPKDGKQKRKTIHTDREREYGVRSSQ